MDTIQLVLSVGCDSPASHTVVRAIQAAGSLEEAWVRFLDADHMMWLAGLADVEENRIRRVCCDLAEIVLPLLPPEEHRPGRAIAVARQVSLWRAGKDELEEVRVAALAAANEVGYRAAYAARAAWWCTVTPRSIPEKRVMGAWCAHNAQVALSVIRSQTGGSSRVLRLLVADEFTSAEVGRRLVEVWGR
jgi:hypothetical protein